jgi:DNA-binding NarL/FixJ family response regulator
MSKLNLHSRAELVRYAVDKGLIDLGSKAAD